jgi:dipeptidyl aminopeptidase/acylaminoacyl peptidase
MTPARIACAVLLAAFAAPAAAQSPAAATAMDFELTVASIMRGPEHVGVPPTAVRWTDDGRWVYFRWKPGGLEWDAPVALYRVPAAGGPPERLSEGQADSLAVLIAPGPVSPDERWRVVSHNGNLHLIDRRTLAVRALTYTRAANTSPVWSRDGGSVYYLSENNVFELRLRDAALRQVTDLRAGPPPADPPAPQGQRAFLVEQQRELFDYIRRQATQRERDDARRDARRAADPLQTVYLDRNERVQSLDIEAAGRYAVVTTQRTGGPEARRTSIPFWITESGYTEPREFRAKVGDEAAPVGRLGIVSLNDGAIRWLDLGRAAFGEDAGGREIGGVRFIGWNETGEHGLVAASAADFKDAWLWSFDAETGALTRLHHLRDEAWVAGPCPFWFQCSGWLPDGRTVWFASERDGYSHLYTVRHDGTGERQLTRGSWEVQSVEISPRRDRFFLRTNEGSPHHVHFWEMRFDGSDRRRITDRPGRQDVTVSPDASRLAIVHSYANEPPDLFLAPNRAGAAMQRITTSPTESWRSFPWIAPEIVWIDAEDGTRVPARHYRPADLGAQPNGAAVIFVHGAGYLQNVHNWWSTYFREYMFHHLLAARGYHVLDIDYRASAGYGRDWRTAIYRHMGGKDLDDHVDGSRWLTREHGIPPERIGIYGGSYGGFITLMALFTRADHFGAGAALRAVTDWAHYNHGYTGRILNLPHDDTLAYRRSSPIYFAEGLEDPLLIAHGMVDVNVHFSDVVRLAQRLIELGKVDWELAVYPVEDHGFVVPSSWVDQYRRILLLFERHINPRGDPDRVQ